MSAQRSSEAGTTVTPSPTLLYVPGDRPDRIRKAIASTAAATVIDLEDAVSPSNKAEARTFARDAVLASRGLRKHLAVRINSASSGLAGEDLAALEPVLGDLAFIMVPMAESPEDLHAVAETTADAADGPRPPMVPLIETSRGVLNATRIAAVEGVATLALGPADLCKELRIRLSEDENEMHSVRTLIVLACAATNRGAPYDGPYLNLSDSEGLRLSAERARAMGFAGKQAIHPSQLDPIAQAFEPSPAEIAWAQAIDTAFSEAEEQGIGSIRLEDGTFIDRPIADRARALLQDHP